MTAIAWALLHSLWEATAIALLLAIALSTARSASTRYALATASLAAIVIAFVATLLHEIPLAAPHSVVLAPTATPLTTGNGTIQIPRSFLAEILPWLTPIWLTGVTLFHLRLALAWRATRRLRYRGVHPVAPQWAARLDTLQTKIRLTKSVDFLESCLTEIPVVIGFLRPTILVPLGMLTGMSANQIDAILLHELAHIQRRDYLVNLLQTLVEGFFFYHPAVWWISRAMREERENSCDDLAVAVTGNALDYSRALTVLEQSRTTSPSLAMAANSGDLMKRIQRLLFPGSQSHTLVPPMLSIAILTITVAAGLFAWQPKPLTPWEKWVTEDVAYIIQDNERAAFRALTTDAEREHFVEQFWERRDPTPGTTLNEYKVEHYSRIAKANNRYSEDIPGWKTDRGRIYIVYGFPDEVESYPSQGKEYWRYKYIAGIGTNVTIEFVRSDGRYRMTKDPNVR